MLHDQIVGASATVVNPLRKKNNALSPTAFIAQLGGSLVEAQYTRKAARVLADNIGALLNARKEDASTLARWCGHDKSWINKILNGHRDAHIEDFDKIADFFGLAVYQLFQPGISALTERRSHSERRSGRDRRIGHVGRLTESLRLEVNKVPHLSVAQVQQYLLPAVGGSHVGAVPATVRALLVEAARLLREHAEQSGGQAPTAGRKVAGTTRRRRAVRGSDPGAPKQ